MTQEEWNTFIDYLDKVHGRTMRVVRCIPPEQIEHSFGEGKFTLGDLVRHLAAIKRYMFAENAQCRPSRYPGHGPELADGPENVMTFFNRMHQESVAIFSRLSRARELFTKIYTRVGREEQS